MFAPLSFAAGALTWSAAEYCIHRFVGHGPRRKRPASLRAQLTLEGLAGAFNEEHLAHHSDPQYFAPTSQKLLAATAAMTAATLVASVLLGPRRGIAYGLGFGLAYGGYEVLHRRIHTHAPRNAYGRWMRRHHLYHHHKTPRANHGVTSPVWDRWIKTEEQLGTQEPLRIPRKVAPPWMLDAQGEIAEQFAADYVLVGSAAKSKPGAETPGSASPNSR
ncbi:MAG: sterol desaturase family protein [Deltaproteobacteria bacterium]|nr:sterol desaturase family protein [Deltaproteobacteria bacterium]